MCNSHTISFFLQGAADTLCNAPTPVGIVVPTNPVTPVRVNFAANAFPTSSVAVKAEQLSLVFVATNDGSIRGVSDLESSPVLIMVCPH